MKRIAIIGGGIAGVSAAYELALLQQAGASIEFVLFEATSRLGGIVETVRHNDFIIECGPDSWVTEKPWARELAIELGLESELVPSQDARRKTYIAEGHTLTAMPEGMRMMVPTRWAGVLKSPLFSWQAKLAYLREPKLAEQLKVSALDGSNSDRDESVQDFVVRHFGREVANTIVAPLLAGVFGGDIATLSARAAMPTLVALEREHGSLILGYQRKMRTANACTAVFTTLRHGLTGLIAGMESHIPAASIQREFAIEAIVRTEHRWLLRGASVDTEPDPAVQAFDAVLVATPAATTAKLLEPLDHRIGELLPQRSSSAIVVALGFEAVQTRQMRIPRGFGFLVPQRKPHTGEPPLNGEEVADESIEAAARRALLACTFLDQKFPNSAPGGAALLRVFFGGPDAAKLLKQDDTSLIRFACTGLERFLGKLPESSVTLVRRWPNSLPLYLVGHLDRMAELDVRIAQLPNLRLIGNAYRGVGLPDLIHSSRAAARELAADLTAA